MFGYYALNHRDLFSISSATHVLMTITSSSKKQCKCVQWTDRIARSYDRLKL